MTPSLTAEDRDFVDCLRRMEAAYNTGVGVTAARRRALTMLINSYTYDAGSDFGRAMDQTLRSGLSVDDLRERLAQEAGISNVAQLKFLASIDRQLASGAIETIDVTDLSDAEYLALFRLA